ncbi:MAG: hypothetical protein K6F33_02295 [Bacteroidales bacterium]|nr:hypothetical protein [Bacteroidales bacterium]
MGENKFKKAVLATPDLIFHEGKGALSNQYKRKVEISDCQGSVDIDQCLKDKPAGKNQCRWDYALGYNNKSFFVEIHSADTKNIDEVIKKVNWLRNWLKTSAHHIDEIKHLPFYWVATSGIDIRNRTKMAKLATMNVKLVASPLVIKNNA